MKILFWTEGFWPNIGGVEVISSEFIETMNSRGHEFSIVTSHLWKGLPDFSTFNGNPLHRYHFQRALDTKDLKEIRRITDDIRTIKRSFLPDLIHINFCGISPFYHKMSAVPNECPTLTTIHALPAVLLSHQSPLVKQVLMASTWISSVSEAMKQDFLSILPAAASKSSVIYNGLPAPALSPTALSFERPQLLCLGRLSQEKGFDVALKSMPRIVSVFPEAHLVIAGNGPAKEGLERLCSSLGMNAHVSFVGWVSPDRTQELMNSSSIVIVPSRWREPFCLVALEAAQLARPVVASRTGALPEVVVHNSTGLLFENENSGSLADSVIQLLENPALAVDLGVKARQRSLTEFDWNNYVCSYEKLYERLSTERIAAPIAVN